MNNLILSFLFLLIKTVLVYINIFFIKLDLLLFMSNVELVSNIVIIIILIAYLKTKNPWEESVFNE